MAKKVSILVESISSFVQIAADALLFGDRFGAGNVGISLVMTIGFSSQLARLIDNWTQMESSIGAVARVRNFVSDTPLDETIDSKVSIPSGWPCDGRIAFDNVDASYQ